MKKKKKKKYKLYPQVKGNCHMPNSIPPAENHDSNIKIPPFQSHSPNYHLNEHCPKSVTYFTNTIQNQNPVKKGTHEDPKSQDIYYIDQSPAYPTQFPLRKPQPHHQNPTFSTTLSELTS